MHQSGVDLPLLQEVKHHVSQHWQQGAGIFEPVPRVLEGTQQLAHTRGEDRLREEDGEGEGVKRKAKTEVFIMLVTICKRSRMAQISSS